MKKVADTGPGIPEEFRAKIFQPFQSTKGDKGTGLGLSMSRSVIEGMGGTIGFESKPGVGARFMVRLPLGSANAGSSEVEPPEARTATAVSTARSEG